ncbi:hypothetical protein M427DRAFT_45684 [Gonapodya prolifera JEL478]|uniref:Uncharacterized protein n=1 Tax=Gonapodya prolifera (strain JEL478) TaxID=1344416 RepID=A0A139A9A1_GONPJ|nr:hypothetical protein M427DRAFT_45684 [Gonapodya prolifera JEL478]|eukprot:KXS13346.1 hypothetical protein M427DRAFT_45684 [Gonapodya prolifera JEL478]
MRNVTFILLLVFALLISAASIAPRGKNVDCPPPDGCSGVRSVNGAELRLSDIAALSRYIVGISLFLAFLGSQWCVGTTSGAAARMWTSPAGGSATGTKRFLSAGRVTLMDNRALHSAEISKLNVDV